MYLSYAIHITSRNGTIYVSRLFEVLGLRASEVNKYMRHTSNYPNGQ